MIAYIRGTLAEKDPTRIVIEAAGVGYEMFIPLSTYDKMPRVGEQVKAFVWHCVREDDEILFGFATPDERELFAKLTSVSGVGPKIAVAMLSGASLGELSMAISTCDTKRIAAIKGVGKKTAEKICIELKDKVSAYAFRNDSGKTESPILVDAIAALRSLGFNEETSSKMVAEVLKRSPSIASVEDVIKQALGSKNSK